jgi:peptidoglycan/xylan/chitin deacetylase (PgdA/CDA1 family)
VEVSAVATRLGVVALLVGATPVPAAAPACSARVYLTLDTGNMSQAEAIAATLKRHDVRATFFLANERTTRGDNALDASWSDYWKSRVAEGHAFGTHTWRHGRLVRDETNGAIRYRPQFGADTGRTLLLTAEQFCEELLLGRPLNAVWRAPGGRTTANALRAAKSCGFSHVHWAPAGFLGDELASEQYPNDRLLSQALRDIRDGDILMAHLGIWSRKDPFAPMLDPLIAELKRRGFCFRPLTDHPRYSAQGSAPLFLPATQSSRTRVAEDGGAK